MSPLMATIPVIRWRLRVVMADKKITATALAQELGVNRVTVSGWVASDEIPNFKQVGKTLSQLCKALKCNLAELAEYVPDDEVDA